MSETHQGESEVSFEDAVRNALSQTGGRYSFVVRSWTGEGEGGSIRFSVEIDVERLPGH